VRVLFADGSTVYKKIFINAVTEISNDSIITHASNGGVALDFIKKHDYDIVVLDVEIKEPNVSDLMDEIMKVIPKALVIITASPSRAHSRLCAELLARGAFDIINKPIYDSFEKNINTVKEKMTDAFDVVKEKRLAKANPTVIKKVKEVKPFSPEMILFAVSTGGPQALQHVFSKLSGNISIPILIVQHIPGHFTEILAGNLNQKSKLDIKVAENRERVEPGTVYLAPGNVHMKLDKKNRVYFDDSPPVHGIRPSADVLFESIVDSFTVNRVLVVIMTGMGNDGTKGLSLLKEKRVCYCIAQSENTCVVYGMPRTAVESGFVDKIVDLDDIASEIEGLVG